MHEGEALYTFGWHDAVFAGVLIAAMFVLIWKNKMPTIGGFRDFVNVVNSRGGNILVLGWLTLYSFRAAMRMFYHLMDLIAQGKLDGRDGVTQLFITFATAQAFGFFAGALIKTMTGSEGGTPVPPTAKSVPAAAASSPAAPAPAGWEPKK